MDDENLYCPVQTALTVIGGKWKPHIFRHLIGRTKRFGKLQSALPYVTRKVLTQQLRELEDDGVVIRTIYPQVPPKVEYSLSDYGKTLVPIISSLSGWGQAHIERDNQT
jgi:DNA-binding HxlR family transcriptional regulator